MGFGSLVGDILQREGDSAILKKVVEYTKSADFEKQFATEANAFRQEAEEALELALSHADKDSFASLIAKMKQTASQAGDKVIPLAVSRLLSSLKLD